MEVLLNETDWLPVADNNWTVDGRLIPDEVYMSMVKNKDATGHIPYWTLGHQIGNPNAERVGSISDIKYENGVLYIKSINLDADFMDDVNAGKYPHLSIEIYPTLEDVSMIQSEDGEEEVQTWGYKFNGVAAISRAAAFPRYPLIKFDEAGSNKHLYCPNQLSEGHKGLNRLDEGFEVFIENYFKKGVNNMADEKIETKIEDTEEIKLEVEEKPEVVAEEKPKKKAGRPKKQISESTYGMDYNMKQDRVYAKEVQSLEKELERKKEDLEEKEKLLEEKDEKLKTYQKTINGQDFIINAQYFLELNKITRNDLQIPDGVAINEPTDYLEYSEVYKTHWDNPETRQYILDQWKHKQAKEVSNKPLGNFSISYEEKKVYTDEEIVKMETQEICKEKGINFHSNQGLQMAIQIETKHQKMPWVLRKKYGME